MTRARGARARWRAVVCVAAMVVACSKAPSSRQTATNAAPPPQARTGTATVTGRVVYQGAPAKPEYVRMSADPYCARANEGVTASPSIRAGADGGLSEVFVSIAGGLEGARYAPPANAVVLDQQRCAYVPRVLGLQVGQPLEIRNSDETLHNVHAMADMGDGFNIGMPHKGMSAVRTFTAPEVLKRIKCDVHPWMTAFAGVVAHPFYAVTREDGAYEIAGVPAGEYTIEAVHFELGSLEQTIVVADGARVQTDFTFTQ